jgi:hypothetical protein
VRKGSLARALFLAIIVVASVAAHPRVAFADEKSSSQPTEAWITGDLLPAGIVDDEYGHGFSQQPSGGINVGADFPVLGQRLLADWQYDDVAYRHAPGDFTQIGGGVFFKPAFINHYYTLEERIGAELPKTPLYLGISQLYQPNLAGHPVLVGLGFGLDKPADTRKNQWIRGRLYYFPYMLSEFPFHNLGQQFGIVRYDLDYGHALGHLGRARTFGSIGFSGEHETAIVNGPVNADLVSLDLNLGIGF